MEQPGTATMKKDAFTLEQNEHLISFSDSPWEKSACPVGVERVKPSCPEPRRVQVAGQANGFRPTARVIDPETR